MIKTAVACATAMSLAAPLLASAADSPAAHAAGQIWKATAVALNAGTGMVVHGDRTTMPARLI